MQIPYEVAPRPDTGLYNAKLGIWLFLASEVMLFGGLFSGYIFLRLGAEPGYWPHGLLNVPVGTMNTIVLILSSVTVIMAWASLKMRQWQKYKFYMLLTILCGAIFLIVKLAYEYPQKFNHFGVFIRQSSLAKYEPYLGNEYLKSKKLDPRVEISGHLHEVKVNVENADPAELEKTLHKRHLKVLAKEGDGKVLAIETHSPGDVTALAGVLGKVTDPATGARLSPGVKMVEYQIKPDPSNEQPTNPENEKPKFFPTHPNPNAAAIHVSADDVDHASAFVPRHSPYFAVYFTITGLHGLHVLAGVLVFIYFYFFGLPLYQRNPEHMANRVEVVGLFWHFVDLVWIFVFPIFYLL